uniref:Tetratricopeptide repeat protein n=1 Tax=Desertifilum tharense IPPAS B-1220 TaxID=1781255 RepID=A0ACD5H2Z2_9CYAN
MFPKFTTIWSTLSGKWVRQARLIAAYQQAIALKSDYAEAYGNLGTAWLYQGDLALAIAAYQKSLSLIPHNAELQNNLGSALRKSGDLETARQCL